MRHYKDNKGNFFGIEDGLEVPDGYIEVSLDDINLSNQEKEQASFDLLPYDKKRQAEYPPFADYLDAIVKGDTAQEQAYIDACLAVKAKYPKTV